MSKENKPRPPSYNNSSSVFEDSSKIDTLRDDPPLTGQKWCCVSMISPEGRQKGQVYAWKLRYVSETPEEAEKMAEYLRDRDPTFDVYVTRVGVWVPWVWSPDEVGNAKYMNSQLTELVSEQRRQRELADAAFDDRVQRELDELKRGNTKEGLAERLAAKEKPVSVYFKILQLQQVIEARQQELRKWESVFHSESYTDEERQHAKEHPYPEVKVAPSAFQHIADDETQGTEHGTEASSASTRPLKSKRVRKPVSRPPPHQNPLPK